MAKRKRAAASTPVPAAADTTLPSSPTDKITESSSVNFQVITGSYDKTLHGFIVTIPSLSAPHPHPVTADPNEKDSISLPATFTDSFLFTAHTSPIRALAISPPSTNALQKRILATSSADEHINLFTLTSILPPISAPRRLTKASLTLTASNPKNKNLGTLSHHLNTPTALVFTPTRSKLISAGLDGYIHILRTRDWAPLSTLKCPKPKPKPVNYATDYGEGYGPRIDTLNSEASYGGGAGGVNDIALHPSQKILLSVGKHSRGMHMWNMMTGRKAGALVPSKQDVPMSFGTEGMRIEWSRNGEEYAIAYERGVVVFGMDSKPKCRVQSTPLSKIHQIKYILLPTSVTRNKIEADEEEVLTISTDDGRVLFYSTTDPSSINSPTLVGFLGGRSVGMPGRIKDFDALTVNGYIFLVTAGTDGVVRVWDLGTGSEKQGREMKKVRIDGGEGRQIGRLVGIYETERRISCLGMMEMGGRGVEDEEDLEVKSGSGSEDDDDDDED